MSEKKPESTGPVESRFFDRELSWLEFNRRVLAEAMDASNPLMERLEFIGIVSSNLDEFFMVRAGGWEDTRAAAKEIYDRAFQQISQRNDCFHGTLVPEMQAAGIMRLAAQALTDRQRDYLRNLFQKEIFPLLTPVAIRHEHPLPFFTNLGIYRFVELREPSGTQEPHYAVIEMPKTLSRLISIPAEQGFVFMLIEDVVALFLSEIFTGYAVLDQGIFRVTRATELTLDEEKDEDFADIMSEALRLRRMSAIVRLEVSAPARMEKFLANALGVAEHKIFRDQTWLGLRHVMQLALQPSFESLRRAEWTPRTVPEFEDAEDFWGMLREKDRIVYHPYESFDAVLRFLYEAARDPDVLAIKQTLYRTHSDSLVIRALESAAENGKQVTVLVELKARFDEERNIHWARRLENAGANVLYGIAGLKTHAKVCLVVRRELEGIRRYAHLGTGNYNEKTASMYSDLSFFTASEPLTSDLAQFFNIITGFSQPSGFSKIDIAPFGLRRKLTRLILREAMRSTKAKPGLILAKMNSLVDTELIEALYRASAQGVQIKLNVRGICCLRPGVKGLSENIEVVSVVDMFLEHSRLFYFQNAGDDEVYASSADWMPRNLDRRVELLFPVEDRVCKAELIEILGLYFRDNVKAWRLEPAGGYRKKEAGSEKPYRVQQFLCDKAAGHMTQAKTPAWRELRPQKPKSQQVGMPSKKDSHS